MEDNYSNPTPLNVLKDKEFRRSNFLVLETSRYIADKHPEFGAHHAALGHALDVESQIASSKEEMVKASGLRKEAIQEFREAIRLGYNPVSLLFVVATVLEADQQFEAAICSYHDLFKADPDHVGGHLRLGKRLIEMGYEDDGKQQIEVAVQAQRKLLETEPSARGWATLGQMLRDLGRIEEAREAWQQASRQPIPKRPKRWSPTPDHYEFRLKEHNRYVRFAQKMLAGLSETQSAA
jgi:tetratricopeptide (TPR) repeat protein